MSQFVIFQGSKVFKSLVFAMYLYATCFYFFGKQVNSGFRREPTVLIDNSIFMKYHLSSILISLSGNTKTILRRIFDA